MAETNEFESLDRQMTLAMEKSDPDSQLSSYVWICTSTHVASTVTVIDAKNPSEVLDSFPVCQTHLLCICSVQGALENDYTLLENSEAIKSGESLEKPGDEIDDIGRVEYIKVDRTTTTTTTTISDANENIAQQPAETDGISVVTKSNVNTASPTNSKDATPSPPPSSTTAIGLNAVVEDINVPPHSPIHLNHRNNNSSNNNNAPLLNTYAFSKPVNPILGSPNPLEEPPMSSVGPTMWLGAQSSMLYVHSSVARWRNCLHSVMLPDAVLSILHVESRVVAALANGKLAIFRRQTDGQWDLNSYHLVTLGLSKQSVRCLCVVGDKIWAAHRNRIHIVDPVTLSIVHTLEAHPRKESQIRQMAATGLGVWVSIR